MVKDATNGKMEECTMVVMKTIKSMVGVSIDGQMEEFILEDGSKANKMMKESTFCQTVKSRKLCGQMAKKDHTSR